MRRLTFQEFREANVKRCLKWHPQGIESWSPSDWLTAVTGELGELASLLKMRNRERDGLPGNKFSPTQKQIADELADVLTYLDLLAEVLGVDLASAAVEKFNAVSARVGFPDRIDLSSPRSSQEEPPAGLVERRTILKPEERRKYWAARCAECGWIGSSRELDGGHAIPETGDYDDVLCPKCQSTEVDEISDIWPRPLAVVLAERAADAEALEKEMERLNATIAAPAAPQEGDKTNQGDAK